MIKTNYHTHSTFCDGKNTAEEIILCAIEKNFDILGFSSHSMFPFSSDWHLPSNSHKEYADSIRSLAKKYSDLNGFKPKVCREEENLFDCS